MRHPLIDDCERLQQLICRSALLPQLVRRSIEEAIISLVDLPVEEQNQLLNAFLEQHQLHDPDRLQAWLDERFWTRDDLVLDLLRPVAIRRFVEQRYGPGLEEYFLSRKQHLDVAIYSLLRVRDPGLARELWIQLSEQEIGFSEAAGRYSDGPEAGTKGVIGPVRLGSIEPQLAERLRSMRIGELRAPEPMGGWHVLLRLEQLTPARFDAGMRETLLSEQFETWIQQRVADVMAGADPDPLYYHREE